MSRSHQAPRSSQRCRPGIAVGELSLVDEEPDVHLAPMDGVLDPIERHHDLDEFGLVEPQRQIGGGEQPRHGDPLSAERLPRVGRAGSGAHQPRAIAVAHGRAGAEERVLPPDVGVGVDRDGGHLELGPAGALIQRLDVRQLVRVAEIAGVELVRRRARRT